MADPFGIGAGILGVISLTIQITQVVVQFGLDWKDACRDVKQFMAELQSLKTVLSETNTNILLNPDFEKAFQNGSSTLLSQLGTGALPETSMKLMLEICRKKLENLLSELKKRAKEHRMGWERFKGAFLAKGTRESVEALHRQCQTLNNMVTIDAIVLGVNTYKEVTEARKEQREWHQAETSQGILSWLTTSDYGAQQSDLLSRRQEGTGQWLLDSGEFRRWSNGDGLTIFSCGMPGAGKTIMASIVVDYLSTKYLNDDNIGIAYIYCNFGREHEQRPTDLLASLLKQLIQGLHSMPEGVKSLYKRHKVKQTRPSFAEISNELHSVIVDYSRTFIVIDALDECQVSDGDRQKLLSEVSNLQAKTNTNLFATSRFIPEIMQEFEGSISLEIRASDEDVQRYLEGHISQLPSFVSDSPDLQEGIKTGIIKAIDGIFLLAQLHLGSLIGKRSPKAIKTALKGLQKGSAAYDHAYKGYMERIEGQNTNSQELAKQILSWITFATRPLTTLELRYALAVERGKSTLDEENLPRKEDMISVCAGLVTVNDESDIIRFVHYTTQEYFERTWIRWFPDAKKDIATTCVTYLSFDVFGSGFCSTDKEYETRLQLNRLYDYAARNWGCHTRAASIEMDPSILDFLESEVKVASASQAMLTFGDYPGYSQRIPKEISGVHLAAYFGLQDAVAALLKNGHSPDLKDTDGETPLLWAAKCEHESLVEWLSRRVLDVNASDKSKRTALHHAASHGWINSMELLLKYGADSEARDSHRQTSLLIATEAGWTEAARLLLKAGANAKALNAHGKGALHLSIASDKNDLEMTALLLAHGAPTLIVDVDNMTPLHYTVRHSRLDIAELLLRNGVPIDICVERKTWKRKFQDGFNADELRSRTDQVPNIRKGSSKGLTPLHYAALVGNSKMAGFFLRRGANPNALSHYGETPLHLSLQRSIQGPEYEDGWTETDFRVEGLWDFVDYEEDRIHEISIEIAEARMAVIDAILDGDETDVTVRASQERSPLHLVRYGESNSSSIVAKLIQSGAKVSACNLKKQTALHLAGLKGDHTSVKCLLHHGADIGNVDNEGKNALHYAAGSGNLETVSSILEANHANIRNIIGSRDNQGRNVLHHSLSSLSANLELVQRLLRDGANVGDIDNPGNSPLAHYLGQFRLSTESQICRLLLQHGANALLINNKGLNLAHLAANCWEVDVAVLEVLMEFGVDTAAVDSEERTLLHHISLRGSLTEEVLTFLLDKTKVDVNGQDEFGKTALRYAIENASQKHHRDLFDSNRWRRTKEILLKHGVVSC